MGRRHEAVAEDVTVDEVTEMGNETSAMPVATESTPPEGRLARKYTAREAFAKVQNILKRCDPEVRAKVLATANSVIELG